MTLQFDPGTGSATHTSVVFEVTVAGSANHVYGITKDVHATATGIWTIGEDVESSWTQFGSDEAAEVRIRLTDAEAAIQGRGVESAFVYPRWVYGQRSRIEGSELIISMLPGWHCVVIVNHVRKQRLSILARPLDDGYDGSDPDTIIYDGTQLEAPANKTLVFEAGVHDIVGDGAWGDKLFPLRDGCTVVMAAGAWIIGTFDYRADGNTRVVNNVTVRGGGTLSGEFTTWETVTGLGSFDEQFAHSMMFGYAGGDNGTGNTISGIQVVNSPFYVLMTGNVIRDCLLLSMWRPNTDGIGPQMDASAGYAYVIERNIIFVGDDAIHAESYHGNGTIRNNIISSSGSACIMHGYDSATPDAGYVLRCTDNTLIPCVPWYETDNTSGGDLIKGQIDEARANKTWGMFHVVYDGLFVDGDVNHAMALNLGPMPYQWGPQMDQSGQLADFTFRRVVIEKESTVRSRIRASDFESGCNGFRLEECSSGGVPWTVRNHARFLDIDEGCFNITIDGVSIVA